MLTKEQKIKQLKRVMACSTGDEYKKAVQQLNTLEEKQLTEESKCQKQKKCTTSTK
jgi:hypothetical protein